jgi:hypothetical protein
VLSRGETERFVKATMGHFALYFGRQLERYAQYGKLWMEAAEDETMYWEPQTYHIYTHISTTKGEQLARGRAKAIMVDRNRALKVPGNWVRLDDVPG